MSAVKPNLHAQTYWCHSWKTRSVWSSLMAL